MVGGGRYDILDADPPRRRWAGLVGSVVLVVLVGGVLVSLVTGRESPQPESKSPPLLRATPQPTLTRLEVRQNVLYPKARTSGRSTEVIDVTFPDGSRARVSYPADLKLAELGVRPAIGVLDGGDGGVGRLYAPRAGEAELAAGGPMLRRLTENVTLWPRRAGQGRGYVSVFTFGRWVMARNDPRDGNATFETRMAVARNLHGKVRKDGYLVLSAERPVRLGRPGEVYADVAVGPQLWFGDVTPPAVVLAPSPGCDRKLPLPPTVTGRVYSATACEGGVHVAVGAERRYAQRLLRTIDIRPLP